MATTRRPKAFVLTGSLPAIARAPRYIESLRARGLRVLLITSRRWRDDVLAGRHDQNNPVSTVDDVAFVGGSVDREGSFVAGTIAAGAAWRVRYRIVGAYAVGETMVEPTGILADALGLPGPGLRASRACRSKYLQRFYLPEFSPQWVVVAPGDRGSAQADAVTYPAVVKPASRHSSSGVVTVTDPGQLAGTFAGYPEHESLLVEQRVHGQEYSVESLVQDGKVHFASITRKGTTESGGEAFVELSHTVPDGGGPAGGALLTANESMLHRLDMRDGVTHAEWRVASDGTPRLMEVAARPPGGGICQLYELATGEPLEPAILDIALDEPVRYPAPTRYARQVYLENRPGTLDDVSVDWPGITPTWVGESGVWPELAPSGPHDCPALRGVFVLRSPGSTLGPVRCSEDRAVSFFIDAPSIAGLDAVERQARAAISVHVHDTEQKA